MTPDHRPLCFMRVSEQWGCGGKSCEITGRPTVTNGDPAARETAANGDESVVAPCRLGSTLPGTRPDVGDTPRGWCLSRGRDRCRVFTDDIDQLREHVTRPSVRVSAHEAMKGEGRLKALSFSVRQGISTWWAHARRQVSQAITQIKVRVRPQRIAPLIRVSPPSHTQGRSIGI